MSDILRSNRICDSTSRSNKGKEKGEGIVSNKRSKVWDEFDEMTQPDGTKKAKCLHCGKHLKCDSKKHGTSQLRRHLSKGCSKKATKIALSYSECKENNFRFDGNYNPELSRCQQIHLGCGQHNDQELSGYQDLVYDEEKNRDFFVKMVIDNKTMLQHVDNPFLKEFASSLQPRYGHVDRRAVEEDCLAFYEKEKAELKDKFRKLTTRVSFSFTKFYNPKSDSYYYCIAAHCIDNNFKLVKRVVGFLRADYKIFEVENFLNDWAFGKRILALTTHYEFEKKLYEIFDGKNIAVGCIVGYFDKITTPIIDEYLDDIIHIESIMRDLNQSSEQMDSFNRIALLYNLPPKSEFNLDNEQGLGASFNMLQDACIYRKVLSAFDSTTLEWSKLEKVVNLLNPINGMVLTLSSCEFPTINLLLKLIFQVKDILLNISPAFSGAKSVVDDLLAGLEDYLACCDEMVQFASLLDPRFKLRFLGHCIEKGISNGKEIVERFHNLYITYQIEGAETINPLNCSEHEHELKKYLDSSSVDEEDENFDVLNWWKSSELEYPVLSKIARDVLAIPVSSSLTSGIEPLSKIIREIFRTTIPTKMSKVLVCCNNWLRSNCNPGRIQNIKEKGQLRPSYKRKTLKAQNELCGIIISENAHLKHHLDRVDGANCEGTSVLTDGNNFIYDTKKCRKLQANMVISSSMSLNLMKNCRFIEWARNLQPMYDPSDVAGIESDYFEFYHIERLKLQNDFDMNHARISMSAQTIVGNEYYHLYVMAHYIDNDFNLFRKIIGIKDIGALIEDRETTKLLERCIQNWGLDEKILAFTFGEGVRKFVYGLKYCIWKNKSECIVHGLFHELSRIILASISREVRNIREITKIVAENPNVIKTFNQLATKYKLLPKSDFQFDTEGGWDSEFIMLQDFLPYKDVFNALSYTDFVDPELKIFLLNESWDKVEFCFKLLKPIYEATIILSSSKYPTSNLCLKFVLEIHDVVLRSNITFKTNNDHPIVMLWAEVLASLAYFWKNCNKVLLIASILDPRIKFVYLQLCYAKHIIGEDEINKCIENWINKYEIEVSNVVGSGKLELGIYLKEDQVEMRGDADFDILKWWKDKQSTYPILSRMASDILAIPVSSVPSEFAFHSPYTKILNSGKHDEPSAKTFEVSECSNNWLSAVTSHFDEVTIEKKTTIDSVEKQIHPLHKYPQQVCHARSLQHHLSRMMLDERVAIDLVQKHVPPPYEFPGQVCEHRFIEHCLSQMRSDAIVIIGDARLAAENMRCLIIHEDGYDKWVPDEVINCYIAILKNQLSTSSKVLMLSTFDTRQLQSWGSWTDKREQHCKRTWSNIIDRGNDFLQHELVFFPIHLQNHWFVGVLNVSKQEFQVLNSLDSVGGPYEETTRELRSGIQVVIDAAHDSKGTARGWRQNMLNWPIRIIPNLPQQQDSSSCGLFALKYMQFWDGSKLSCQFNQYDIHLFRKLLARELIFSKLNERKDIQDEIKKKYMFL